MPRSGFQSFFSVLTQISPFFATFGWKIFVRKNAFGGVCGKSFPRASFTRKTPPAYGVPAGTEIFKTNMNYKESILHTLTIYAFKITLPKIIKL
jgi:hypothetical protein